MKKHWIKVKSKFPLILGLFLTLSACQQMSEKETDNSAGLNGGFEISKNNLPVNWLMYSPNTVPNADFEIELDKTIFKEGKQSLRFDVKNCSSTGGWFSPGFTNEFFDTGKFEGECIYKLSFWIQNKGTKFRVNAGSVAPMEGEMKILIESDKPSFKDPPLEVCYFSYKRINHFNEWLAQFQAKESTEIPDEVYEKIIAEIKKERIKDLSKLDTKKIRQYLKKIKLNKFYDHAAHILYQINGIPPPSMSKELEEKLRLMFKEIQGPFLEVCPKSRKNFLNYSYVLHKFVELLSLDEYKVYFPLLKDREKLHQTDMIWKNICNKLGWQFYKSI